MSTGFSTYCLGTGAMDRCKTCRHEKNWLTLNEMPDALRKPMQAKMLRVNESRCQIASGAFYEPAHGRPPQSP